MAPPAFVSHCNRAIFGPCLDYGHNGLHGYFSFAFVWAKVPIHEQSTIHVYLKERDLAPGLQRVDYADDVSRGLFNPMHPVRNSLKKQKSMYIVLTPSIKTSI